MTVLFRLVVIALALAACRSAPASDARQDALSSRRLVVEAASLVAEGDVAESSKKLGEAIRLDPSNAAAYALRGHLHRRLREQHAALSDFEKALELRPDDAALQGQRAAARRATGDFDGALADWNRAIEKVPDSVELRVGRAMLLARRSALNAAMADLDKAFQLTSGAQPMLYANRALIHLWAGDEQAARDDFAQAFDAEPSRTYPALLLAGLGGDLERLRRAEPEDAWTAHLRRFWLEKTDPAHLLAVAGEAPTQVLRLERTCEAHAYAGMRADREGRASDAIAAYRAAVATGVHDFFETTIAEVRLRALATPRAAP